MQNIATSDFVFLELIYKHCICVLYQTFVQHLYVLHLICLFYSFVDNIFSMIASSVSNKSLIAEDIVVLFPVHVLSIFDRESLLVFLLFFSLFSSFSFLSFHFFLLFFFHFSFPHPFLWEIGF